MRWATDCSSVAMRPSNCSNRSNMATWQPQRPKKTECAPLAAADEPITRARCEPISEARVLDERLVHAEAGVDGA